MAGSVKPIPEGYHSVTPYLCIKGASEAIEFYKSAFDATELMRIPSPDGSIGHAEIQIGDSRIMIPDESPKMDFRSPATIGWTPVHVYIYVEDADRIFAQANAAGATAMMPLEDQFWGDRTGTLVDPFGHRWCVSTHKEGLTEEEIGARAAKLFGGS